MSDWLTERVRLGKTDLRAGRLGLGAAYRAPSRAIEEAFERGCNLMYWGALRSAPMARAIRDIAARCRRDDMIVVIQAMLRSPDGVEGSLTRGLRRLGLSHADVLLLGWHNRPPGEKLLRHIEKMRERGLFRYSAVSGHHRPLFPELAKDARFDLFWVRYNAANRGGDVDLFPHLPCERPGIVAFTATRRMSLARSRRIPSEEKRPTAGDCYRFVLTNPAVDVVITAPMTIRQMRDNLDRVAAGPMDIQEMAWMRRIGDYVYGAERPGRSRETD